MIVVAAGRGKPGGGGLFPGFFPGDALRAMALTLRPSDVDRSRWIAFDGGIPIGRIYQRHTPASADVAWFWSITSYVEPRAALRTSGTTGTLDAAKAAFRATWEQWQSWAAKAGFDSRPG